MFKVCIEYIEKELTRSEVEALAKQRYGSMGSVNVKFSPIDNTDQASLDFVLDGLITDKQVNALFGDKDMYEYKLASILQQVKTAIDNRLDYIVKYNEDGRL